MTKETIAIVGTGPAGLICGHLLHEKYDISVFEQNDYVGGHAHTITLETGGETLYTDTAFVVLNSHAYPLFNRLLRDLNVETMRCPMSFGFQIKPISLEYYTHGLTYCFCDLKNLTSLRFWKMLYQMVRFYRQSPEVLTDQRYQDLTLADYIKVKGFGEDFQDHFLVPLLAVTWSLPPAVMRDYPVKTLLEFLQNHGALQSVLGKTYWSTVVNGSGRYVEAASAPYQDRIQLNNGAASIKRINNKVQLTDSRGQTRDYDRVILACHAQQALQMITDPTSLEHEILSTFKYHQTRVLVHSDSSFLPANRRRWGGWNYYMDYDRDDKPVACYTYHMNKLQKVSKKNDVFVTVNDIGIVDKDKVYSQFDYEHPMFDHQAVAAQAKLGKLNDNPHTYFCGSYFGYGFHEDAIRSGYQVCQRIGGEQIWQ